MKVGILLPSAVDLGLLRRAQRLSRIIAGIEDADGTSWSVAIGVPEDSEEGWRAIERELRGVEPSAIVRHLKWETVPVENARRMFAKLSPSLDLSGIEDVVVPRDWGWNFQDCDVQIVFADPGLGAVLPLVPTLFYCPDLAVRIVPKIAAKSIDDEYWTRQTDAFRIWRQAGVATADPFTIEDIVGYAGVRREKVSLFPKLLDTGIAQPSDPVGNRSNALAWLIQSAAISDVENAAKGLRTYLSEGGRLEPLLVIDAVRTKGADASLFYEEGLPKSVADFLYGLPSETVSSERELIRLLRRTSAIWSSRLAGGEGEAPSLATEIGIPFVGADYGANREPLQSEIMPSVLYELNDPLAIADALHAIEKQIDTPAVGAEPQDLTSKRAEVRALLECMLDPPGGG